MSEPLALLCQLFSLSAYVSPLDRQGHDCAAVFNRLHQMKRLHNHLALQHGMKRDTEMMSHGPGKKKSPGHFDHLTYVSGHGDRNRWSPSELNCTLNQSYGLMANRSSRSEYSNIGLFVLANSAGNIRGDCLFEPFRIHVIADEAEEMPGQTADCTFRYQVL